MILRILLGLLGIAFTAFGVNIGAGGLSGLGLLVDPGFVTTTDPAAFAIHDSHVRFVGGVFTAIGLSYAWGAMRGPAAYPLLIILSAFIAAGGVFRLTGPLPPAVWPSFAAEILLMPALIYWLWRERLA